MKAIVKLYIIGFCFLGFSQTDQSFDDGNALYNDGKYAEAIEKYESIIATGVHSSELYFNLGNANYKLNNIAPSIYNYEKALLLSPNDSEIKNNLAFAQNMTIDAIDKVPQVGFARIINNLVNTFSADTWAKLAIGASILFVLLFLGYRFSYASAKKRLAFVTSAFSLLFACIAVAMAFQKERLDKRDNPAIVFAQESRVKAEANKTSEEVFRLHEGTKINVIETYDDWYKIQLSDNSTGWIPSQDIQLLKSF